jgi:outer membrane murein-binding lipoprotein Lpp
MNKTQRTVLVAAAMAGIVTGSMLTSGCSNSEKDNSMAPAAGTNAPAADTGKHDCQGKNTCKGQGGCKSSDNGCKGKNSCTGKGGCNTKGSCKAA